MEIPAFTSPTNRFLLLASYPYIPNFHLNKSLGGHDGLLGAKIVQQIMIYYPVQL